MKRRQLAIDINSQQQSSDGDLREVLNIYEHHRIRNFDDEKYNYLCRLCFILLKIEQRRVLQSFNNIKKQAEKNYKNMQASYSKMLELENQYLLGKMNEILKSRSRSQNVDRMPKQVFNKSKNMFVQKFSFKASSKQYNQQQSIGGKKILSKLNEIQKQLKIVKKQANLSKKQLAIHYPEPPFQYSRHNSERYLYHPQMIQSQYHVVRKNEPQYIYSQNPPIYHLQNRSVYRPVSILDRQDFLQNNSQRPQRLRTQQTVSTHKSKEPQLDLKQQIKAVKQLIKVNLQIAKRNQIAYQNKKSEEQSGLFSKVINRRKRNQRYQQQQQQQNISHKMTLKEKETQPTYRSYQKTLNFQQQNFQKKNSYDD